MNKEEIIRLYIEDLKSKVADSDARNNRIMQLEDELESCLDDNAPIATNSDTKCNSTQSSAYEDCAKHDSKICDGCIHWH